MNNMSKNESRVECQNTQAEEQKNQRIVIDDASLNLECLQAKNKSLDVTISTIRANLLLFRNDRPFFVHS